MWAQRGLGGVFGMSMIIIDYSLPHCTNTTVSRTKTLSRATQEVELRALLSPREKKRLLRYIIQMGGKQQEVENLIDVYFCPQNVASFSEIEMNEVGSYSLRLRKQVRGKKVVIQMNIKQITTYGDHNAWEEHEVVLDSFKEGRAILVAIGFKEFFSLRKRRMAFTYKKFNIFIEDIYDFGPILEIEVMTTKARAEDAKRSIRTLFLEMGVNPDSVVPKSVTNLLMKKNAHFI